MRAGEASETARRVAAQRLTFERITTAFGDPDADDRLARDVAGPLAGRRGTMAAYLEARTRFFDQVVVGALSRGVSQVVTGAAGYDGRSLRYGRPGLRWFELDHPATQQDKLDRLRRLGIDASHVMFVPADFDVDPVAERLRAAGVDPEQAGLFLLEGVAVYLERATLTSLLQELRTVAGPGSRLAISLSVSGGSAARRVRRLAFQASVAALGEPTRSSIEPSEVAPLLREAGWQADEPSDDASARRRHAGLVLATATG